MKIKTFIAVVIAIVGISIYIAATFRTDAEKDSANEPPLYIENTDFDIDHGKYLATNVYMCMDCHSEREYSRFGYNVVEGTLGKGSNLFGLKDAFPGDFYAPNITPYALKDWSNREIFNAITKGMHKDGSQLYPLMPYVEYSRMDPEDIYDIIAYLRTLEPIASNQPRSSSNLPAEILLDPVGADFVAPKKPSTSNQVAYGKYLVDAGTCAGCHTPRDKRGAPVAGMDFAGGTPFYIPGGKVRSVNITPDFETGIGSWTKEVFVERFKRFQDPGDPVNTDQIEPGDFNTAMPWRFYSNMSEAELEAIFAYLQTLEPVSNSVIRFSPTLE